MFDKPITSSSFEKLIWFPFVSVAKSENGASIPSCGTCDVFCDSLRHPIEENMFLIGFGAQHYEKYCTM
jgi:hypothetical protein